MLHFSQKFSAHFLDEIICKHFWPPWNTIVSVKLLFLQKNSLETIYHSFQLNAFSKSLCFLHFYSGSLMPGPNWNRPNNRFSVKVPGKQDKIFSTFFTRTVDQTEVTPFHSIWQGLWDAHCHLSNTKDAALTLPPSSGQELRTGTSYSYVV